MSSPAPTRLRYVDRLRGLIMAHMALDHVSLFFNPLRWDGEFASRPPPPPADLGQFLVRFTGVAVAPGFSFMAGFMVAYSSRRREARGLSRGAVTGRLVRRGLLLLALEQMGGRLGGHALPFGVLSCLGACLVLTALLRTLPAGWLAALTALTLGGHPLLHDLFPQGGPLRFLYGAGPSPLAPGLTLQVTYPVLPWLGVMLAGFLTGQLLPAGRPPVRAWAGAALLFLLLFFLIRLPAGYGNAYTHEGLTSLRFWVFAKYPPDLAWLTFSFAQIYAGLALLAAWEERPLLRVLTPLETFGRVPLFFYLLHFLVLGAVAAAGLLPPAQSLGELCLRWLLLLLALYPLCRAYGRLKLERPNVITRYV